MAQVQAPLKLGGPAGTMARRGDPWPEEAIGKEALDPRPPPCIPPRRAAPFAVGGTFTHEGSKKALSECGTYTVEEQVDAYKFARETGAMGLSRSRGASKILEQAASVVAKPRTRTSAGIVGVDSHLNDMAYKETRRTSLLNIARRPAPRVSLARASFSRVAGEGQGRRQPAQVVRTRGKLRRPRDEAGPRRRQQPAEQQPGDVRHLPPRVTAWCGPSTGARAPV